MNSVLKWFSKKPNLSVIYVQSRRNSIDESRAIRSTKKVPKGTPRSFKKDLNDLLGLEFEKKMNN